jgi:serine protease Do
MTIAREILEKGGTKRGFLGVRVMNVSKEIRAKLGNPSIAGAVVTEVVPGSPAESIGIAPWDVITGFGTDEIRTVSSLRDMVVAASPGDLVAITFLRGAEARSKDVRIAPLLQEHLRQPAVAPPPLKPEDVERHIESLKRQIEVLEDHIKELEEYR